MEITLTALADFLGGALTHPERGDVVVSNARSLEAAGPGDVAFLWDRRYAEAAQATRATVVVAQEAVEGVPCVVVADAEAAMLALLGEAYARRHPPLAAGVHETAWVAPTATLGPDVAVGPGAVIEDGASVGARAQIRARAYVGRNVRVGEDCTIHPHATVLDRCTLGDRVTVWSGAVIGKDGFGFLQREGRNDRIPHVGSVRLEDDVEVGALSTVTRGAMEDTVLERGVIVDDHCHIAHNCVIGEYSVLVGRTAMGGSVTVGKRCFLLQDAGVSTGLSVGDEAIVGTCARVFYKDVPAGERVAAVSCTYPHITTKRVEAMLPRLPKMRLTVKRLEERIASLERRLADSTAGTDANGNDAP